MIPAFLMNPKILVRGGLVVATALALWFTYSKGESAGEAAARAEYAEAISEIARVANEATAKALEEQQKAERRLAELDRRYTEELSREQAENDALRDAVAAGKRRLRIQAECPAGGDAVLPAGTAAGVDDGAGARLTDAAERNYHRLRERITTITGQVNALQEYVREQCLSGHP